MYRVVILLLLVSMFYSEFFYFSRTRVKNIFPNNVSFERISRIFSFHSFSTFYICFEMIVGIKEDNNVAQ